MNMGTLLGLIRKDFQRRGVALYRGTPEKFDYFDVMDPFALKTECPSPSRWLIYLVPGGSEGYYLHVDTLDDGNAITTVLLGKCWTIVDGMQAVSALVRMFDWTRPQTCILED